MNSTELCRNYVVKYCRPLYLHSHVDTVWESYKSLSTNWPKKYWWNHLGTAFIWIWQKWAKSWHWHWEREGGWALRLKWLHQVGSSDHICCNWMCRRRWTSVWNLSFHPAWQGVFYSWHQAGSSNQFCCNWTIGRALQGGHCFTRNLWVRHLLYSWQQAGSDQFCCNCWERHQKLLHLKPKKSQHVNTSAYNLIQEGLARRGLNSFQQEKLSGICCKWCWERRTLQYGGLAIDMHKPLLHLQPWSHHKNV